jgi:TM1410 hypothetical-related protein.
MKFSKVLALCCPLLLSTVSGLAQAANPFGIAFARETNVSLYGKPTGLLITGRCNRYEPEFAAARAKGAEVLAYLNPATRPDSRVCALDQAFYMNDYGAVPLWPYPTYGQRSIWPNTKMTDIRPGSKWILWVVSYVEKLMRENKVDGVFLDNIGGRPWGSSNWTQWSQAEKNAWTDGSIDLVRRLDAKRRAINPNFIIVNNNIWAITGGSTRGLPGEKYVDGVNLEHPYNGVNPYHLAYAKKPFSNLGHRRLLVTAKSATEAKAWAAYSFVTHVSPQVASQYGNPTVPVVSFKALTDR